MLVDEVKAWADMILGPNHHGGGLRGEIKGNRTREEFKGASTLSLIFLCF